MKFKFRILKITIIALILVLVYHLALPAFQQQSTAYAVGDLIVNWGVAEGDPIFVVNNWTPGQIEQRTVGVTNNATVVRAVGVRGIKTSESGNISQVINFVISQEGIDLYGGTTGAKTLAQFFTDSGAPNGIFLSNLNPSASTNYTFKATFNLGAGNAYKAKSIIFDLKIGINFQIPEECQNIQFSGNPIFGTDQRDVLNGTAGNDMIVAFGGDDVVNGHGGDDCIIGGEGKDILHGQNGNDILIGGAGTDKAFGDLGTDTCSAEAKTSCEL